MLIEVTPTKYMKQLHNVTVKTSEYTRLKGDEANMAYGKAALKTTWPHNHIPSNKLMWTHQLLVHMLHL